jgi:hypothetical protein
MFLRDEHSHERLPDSGGCEPADDEGDEGGVRP